MMTPKKVSDLSLTLDQVLYQVSIKCIKIRKSLIYKEFRSFVSSVSYFVSCCFIREISSVSSVPPKGGRRGYIKNTPFSARC